MITVNNLTKVFESPKKYPGFKGAIKTFLSGEKVRKVAVDQINFTINEGEIVGYIGANGAGKSTTIKMMAGILTPTDGSVVVNGLIPYEQRQKNARNIGVVFGQKTQLWWDLPISETFLLLKEIYQVSDEDYAQRMKFFNELFNLDEFFLSPVRNLSLGQRMRADLAAALLHNPKILFLDEPTIGLDVVVKEAVRKAIKSINQQFNTTIILTTHDLNDIEELCQRIIIIDEGKIIYNGDLVTIKQQFGNRTTLTLQVKEPLTQIVFNHPAIENTIEQQDLTITFDKGLIPMPEVISQVMNQYTVLDFAVKETEIEDIVKKLYRHEV